jgi:hypothetical protein
VLNGSGNNTTVTTEVDSLQMSYSMGGASVKVAETSMTDGSYNTANDKDATTVALTLAF